jgi:hypothetical protein
VWSVEKYRNAAEAASNPIAADELVSGIAIRADSEN